MTTTASVSTSLGNTVPSADNSVLVLDFDRHGFAGACLQVMVDGFVKATPRLSRSVAGYTLDEALEAACREVAIYGWAPVGGLWVRA